MKEKVKNVEKAHKRELTNKKRIQHLETEVKELSGAVSFLLQTMRQTVEEMRFVYNVMEKGNLLKFGAEDE